MASAIWSPLCQLALVAQGLHGRRTDNVCISLNRGDITSPAQGEASMAAGISRKSTTAVLAVPDQHNPPPGYKAPIVCDGIVEMRDVMVPMRDGKHLCV